MADNNDRIVYPDEVEDAKKAAAKTVTVEGGDTNTVEEPEPTEAAASTANPQVAMRNMIQVPDNCPEGYELINGVCREVFD